MIHKTVLRFVPVGSKFVLLRDGTKFIKIGEDKLGRYSIVKPVGWYMPGMVSPYMLHNNTYAEILD